MIFGRLPTRNLPTRSHEKDTNHLKRKPPTERIPVQPPKRKSFEYGTFGELCRRIVQLKTLNDWKIIVNDNNLSLTKHPHSLRSNRYLFYKSISIQALVFQYASLVGIYKIPMIFTWILVDLCEILTFWN